MNERWILVTGASSGIGLQTSKLLLENGYNVILTSRNIVAKQDDLDSYDKSCYRLISCDLTQPEEIKELAKEILQKAGRLSGLVHCAGITVVKPFSLNKREELDRIFQTNVYSVFDLLKIFAKEKHCKCPGGSFVLLSSLSTEEGALGRTAYASSKGALEGMLKSAAAECIQKGIRLNIVCPGIIKTPMTEVFFNKLDESGRKKLLDTYPLGLGEPKDVAHLIEFLLSEKSRWITGQKFVIDGGHLLCNHQ